MIDLGDLGDPEKNLTGSARRWRFQWFNFNESPFAILAYNSFGDPVKMFEEIIRNAAKLLFWHHLAFNINHLNVLPASFGNSAHGSVEDPSGWIGRGSSKSSMANGIQPSKHHDLDKIDGYPLVNIKKTMENHHVQWVNPLFLWSFSIAMLNYQRLTTKRMRIMSDRLGAIHLVYRAALKEGFLKDAHRSTDPLPESGLW